MKRESLNAQKRTILGKKVKHLRREGILPGNMFGRGIKSLSVQLPLKDFQEVYKKVHETGLVDLTVEKDTYPVLIQNVHIHPTTFTPLHADFFKVNLKEKVKASIPIIAIGEPKAVTDKIGVLLQTLSEVEVEALPADLPENIEVNVENLANIDEHITLGDLKLPHGVEITAEPSEMVFRIGELVSEEAEELAVEEAAEAEAASEEAAEKEEKTEEESEEPSQEGNSSENEKGE
jgi:large subunit ribosomal protein L25